MKLAAPASAGCPIFPASSPWNERVDDRPVHPRSDAMVQAIGATDPVQPAMGSASGSRASVDLSGMPRQARVIATALKRYGKLIADNGSNWFISGAPDPGWDNDGLRALKRLRGTDFEVVS